MNNKSVLLIIGGGIAAYKSLALIRELRRQDFTVRAILTKAGAEFITPLSVASLTGNPCYTDLFDLTAETEMGHIELSRSAELVVAAPATADLLAKAANGLANDLASTALLATDKPVLFAPAMNVRMWEHPATRRNIETLRRDGAQFIGPDEGEMACGEYGPGRMADPEAIAAAIESFFLTAGHRPLAGKKILVTAGPTHEALDPVRYLANRSSGRQGYAIARALHDLGGEVILVSGPTALSAPPGVKMVNVQTALEMMAACEAALPADCFIACAAVADYRPLTENNQKIKKELGGMSSIPVTENPDILKKISQRRSNRPKLVIGFAAETENIQKNAVAKRKRKGCDWIIANDVSPGPQSAMGGARNKVTLISDKGVETWPAMEKADVASKLARLIADTLIGSGIAEAAE